MSTVPDLPEVETYVDRAYAGFFSGPSWCAKCVVCGKVLTKFDFTEEEALRIALGSGHRCR